MTTKRKRSATLTTEMDKPTTLSTEIGGLDEWVMPVGLAAGCGRRTSSLRNWVTSSTLRDPELDWQNKQGSLSPLSSVPPPQKKIGKRSPKRKTPPQPDLKAIKLARS